MILGIILAACKFKNISSHFLVNDYLAPFLDIFMQGYDRLGSYNVDEVHVLR